MLEHLKRWVMGIMDNRKDPYQGAQVVSSSEKPIIGYAIDEDLTLRRVLTNTGCFPVEVSVGEGVSVPVVGSILAPTQLNADGPFYLGCVFNADAVNPDDIYITNADGDILYVETIPAATISVFTFQHPFGSGTEAYWDAGTAGSYITLVPVARRVY